MAEKTRGFIADEIRVTPKNYVGLKQEKDDFIQKLSGIMPGELSDQKTKDNCWKVAEALRKCFIWEDSPQGYDYWKAHYEELGKLSGKITF